MTHHFDSHGPRQPAAIIVPLQQPGATVVPFPSLPPYLYPSPSSPSSTVFSYFVHSFAMPCVCLVFHTR